MQWAVIKAFKDWEIDKSLSHYIKEVWEKYEIIISALEENWLLGKDSPIEFTESEWGFYLWGRFKDWRNTDKLSKEALQYWVSFVPWSIYGKQAEYNDSFRIAYAQIDKEKIVEAIKRFHKLVQNTM